MEILLFIFLIIFTWLGYKYYRNVLNPITIFISWSLLLILFGLWSNIFSSEYHGKTFIILMSSYIVYFGGVLFGDKIKVRNGDAHMIDYTKLRKCIMVISVIVDVCVLLYFWYLFTNVGIMQIFSDLSAFNMEIQDGYFSGKAYYQVLFMSTPLSLIILYYLLKHGARHKLMLKIQFIICFLPYISVRRDTLFNMILINIILWYLINIFKPNNNGASTIFKRNAKIICMVIAAFTFMSFTQKLLNKALAIQSATILGLSLPDFMVDPIVYLLGSFPYFDLKLNISGINFVFPFISTLRIPMLYIQAFFGNTLDLTTPFALDFLNIGNSTSVLFNTAPIQYYSLVEFGFLYPIYYFVLGCLSGFLYKKFYRFQGVKDTLLVAILFGVLFWSVRGYMLIYVSVWITVITILIVEKIVRKGKNK